MGEYHAKARLAEDQVCEIRRLVHDVGTTMATAHRLVAPGVRYITVVKAATYENWKHVK